MRNVVISADGDRKVYSAPDAVADNLDAYCMEFCSMWLKTSPHAGKYRVHGVLCYNEDDFIDYLNHWVFPNEKSSLVENLGWIEHDSSLPEPHSQCPVFNF